MSSASEMGVWLSVDEYDPPLGEKVVVRYKGWEMKDEDATEFDYADCCADNGVVYFVNSFECDEEVESFMCIGHGV